MDIIWIIVALLGFFGVMEGRIDDCHLSVSLYYPDGLDSGSTVEIQQAVDQNTIPVMPSAKCKF